MHKREFLWMFSVMLFVVSFVAFRSLADVTSSPFASEITAAFIGTMLTVIVTALLLKHQSAGEELKEKNVKIYEAKLTAYVALMETIEEIVLNSDPQNEKVTERAKIQIALQCEKTRFIANAEVEAKLRLLVREYVSVLEDGQPFSYEEDWKPISGHVAAVALAIKQDLERHLHGAVGTPTQHAPAPLLGGTAGSGPNIPSGNKTAGPSDANASPAGEVISTPPVQDPALAAPVEDSSFTPRGTTRSAFLAQCSTPERDYFESVFSYCEANSGRIILDWGTKGVSIKDSSRRPLVWMFPTREPKWNIQFIPKGYTDAEKAGVEAELVVPLLSLISYKPASLPLDKLKPILDLLSGAGTTVAG